MPTNRTVGTKSVTTVQGEPLGTGCFSFRKSHARIRADATAPNSTAKKIAGFPS